ncbi:hypothetical protein IW262DRAFT_660602 [Armillaria fumosa]|nr:hypothetical protein IW262DRAFT_660602 [Armillaria fumosa]
MRIVVISGLLTSTCSLLTLISYIVWPDTLIFLAIGTFILPKLYINSLLAMLNSRKSSMWSVGKEYQAEQKMIRFAPGHDAENGVADSGQTVSPGHKQRRMSICLSMPPKEVNRVVWVI